MKRDLSNVKIGDKFILERSQFGERTYNPCEVIKITNTRFEVQSANGTQVFNKKDGQVYGHSSYGVGRTYYYLRDENDPELNEIMKRQLLSRRAMKLMKDMETLIANRVFMNEKNDHLQEDAFRLIADLGKVLNKYKKD